MAEKVGAVQPSVFSRLLEELPKVKDAQGNILTGPFLDQCDHVIPILDSLGAALLPVKHDIHGNIQRLRKKFLTNPIKYEQLYSIPLEEVAEKTFKQNSSCSKGLLWLKRAMEFIDQLLQFLVNDPKITMSDAATKSYEQNLMRFHNFFTKNIFHLAMKVCPSREHFVQKLGGSSPEATMLAMSQFVGLFSPLLAEIHDFLDKNGLNDQSVV